MLSRKFEKFATPPTAATAGVLLGVSPPPTGPLAMLIVTVPLNEAVLPSASRAVTWTAGLIGMPAVLFAGCIVKMSCVAIPPVMLKALLLNAPATPADVAWSW